jgi:hypothetical protein
MIGVAIKDHELQIAAEFFQLFKTPWERYKESTEYDVVLTTQPHRLSVISRLVIIFSAQPTDWDPGIGIKTGGPLQKCRLKSGSNILPIYGKSTTLVCGHDGFLQSEGGSLPVGVRVAHEKNIFDRIGFDLFSEVGFLLKQGQPSCNSRIPTLDHHIALVRSLIIGAGIPLVEIPPVPARHRLIVCLTHDIDFIGIRYHFFDHSFLGFLYRATIGTFLKASRKNIPWQTALVNFKAVASIPLIFLGWARDFWFAFERYLTLEQGLNATYFFCPFKNTAGEKVDSPLAYRRAMRYDIDDVDKLVFKIIAQGHEVGVHGIDAWHDAEKGKKELERISKTTGSTDVGIRMHWLCTCPQTAELLEKAGYTYDSTGGYNDAVGFKAGTAQAFVPQGAKQLLELPLHLQDTALFYPGRMALTFEKSIALFQDILASILKSGGVFTILWHDRSLAPERLWEKPYKVILDELIKNDPWFATGGQATSWFRKRRSIKFGPCLEKGNLLQISISSMDSDKLPGLKLRMYFPGRNDSGLHGTVIADHLEFKEIEIPTAGKYLFVLF